MTTLFYIYLYWQNCVWLWKQLCLFISLFLYNYVRIRKRVVGNPPIHYVQLLETLQYTMYIALIMHVCMNEWSVPKRIVLCLTMIQIAWSITLTWDWKSLLIFKISKQLYTFSIQYQQQASNDQRMYQKSKPFTIVYQTSYSSSKPWQPALTMWTTIIT